MGERRAEWAVVSSWDRLPDRDSEVESVWPTLEGAVSHIVDDAHAEPYGDDGDVWVRRFPVADRYYSLREVKG